MFVTFEGIDGSGKSTQAELLAQHLRAEGRDVVALREPGGTPLGERIRGLLLDGPEMSAWAEAALFAAARAELVERVIRPALARGADVVCDRYVDSSLAYQGVARKLGIDAVLELNLAATAGLLPERTFVLLLDPARSRARMTAPPDRIEREDEAFVRRLDDAYRQIVSLFPERCVALDATGSPGEIAEEVRDELARSDTRAVRGQATA
jgi:dTMP kinase